MLTPGAKRGEIAATPHGDLGTILEWAAQKSDHFRRFRIGSVGLSGRGGVQPSRGVISRGQSGEAAPPPQIRSTPDRAIASSVERASPALARTAKECMIADARRDLA